MASTNAKVRGRRGHGRRKLLLVFTIAVGTAALTVAWQLSSRLDRLVSAAVEGGGRRIVVANASIESDGSFDWQRPIAFKPEDRGLLAEAGAGVRLASLVNQVPIREIEVEGERYRPGQVYGSDEFYPRVMGLEIVAGSFFSEEDVRTRAKSVVLSERAAKALFPSAHEAIGKSVRADRGIMAIRGPGQGVRRTESAFDAFTVSGVFGDVGSFDREVFGIPDYIIPWTTMFPADMRIMPIARTFVALADSRDVRRVESGLRSSLAATKGEDLKLSVWEGSPGQRGSTALARMRSALSSLSLVSKVFGLVILSVAGFGVASGMAAEAAERKRELAIRRAVGLTATGAAFDLIKGSLVIAAWGSLTGFAVATLFSRPAAAALAPFVEMIGIDATSVAASAFEPESLLAPLCALLLAPLFSALPAIRAATAEIVSGLKE